MMLTVGYGLLGIGPLVAFFVPLLADKSFLVLLTFLSAFFWLVVLALISAIFRAFVPIHPSATSYAGVLLVFVAIEEVARVGLWKAHLAIVSYLEQQATRSGRILRQLDRVYLAMGWGLGQATTHALFFHASFLPLTVQGGTWYIDSCPAINVFLAGSLLTLGYDFLLVSIMVLALEGGASSTSIPYSRLDAQLPQQHLQNHQQQLRDVAAGGRGRQIGLAALAHGAAALLMLLNFATNGCLATIPLLLALGLSCTWHAAKVFQHGKTAAGLMVEDEHGGSLDLGDEMFSESVAGRRTQQRVIVRRHGVRDAS